MNINDLYAKVHDFESKIRRNVQALSSCRESCSKCCYTDLSVFQIEADNIRNWFFQLNDIEKTYLKNRWKLSPKSMLNFKGEEVSSCSFLRNESCTIYEARPLICRTQGLGLKYKEGEETYLDICPLNESMLEELLDSELINLDLLNTILSQLEKMKAPGTQRKRMKLTDLLEELWTE
jgi:uncharacterized protein